MLEGFNGMFTPAAIAQTIEQAKPLNLPIRQLVYRNSETHPLPVIGVDEIAAQIKNIPVVRRGTAAVPVGGGGKSFSFIEPQGVDASDFVSAATLANWKMLDGAGLNAVVTKKQTKLMRICQKTTEALCSQSLKGKIEYQMKTDGSSDLYEISFGDTLSYTPSAKWSNSTKTADIFTGLSEMDSLIQDEGWGGEIVTLAGKKAFQTIVAALGEKTSNAVVSCSVNDRELSIGGYKIKQVAASYVGSNGKATKEIAENEICMIDLAAPHTLFYLALDDIEAGLVALPFFASPEQKKNPSGIEIVGRSKPLPAPVCKAICWAKVC